MTASRETYSVLALAEVLALAPTEEPTWPRVFDFIERNHVAFAPDHWAEFLDHVSEHGILTPVVACDGQVFSGHHRVWAAHRLGLDAVPVVATSRPGPWLWLQSRREQDLAQPLATSCVTSTRPRQDPGPKRRGPVASQHSCQPPPNCGTVIPNNQRARSKHP